MNRLRGPFPWVEFFSPADREAFAQEIVDVARACAAMSRFDRLLITLTAWHSTAQAIADGYTHDEHLEWLDVPEPVADPQRPGIRRPALGRRHVAKKASPDLAHRFHHN